MVDASMLRSISTITELVILALLIASVGMARVKGSVSGHWKLMATASMLNAFAVLVLMVPRFLTMADGLGTDDLSFRTWMVIAHHTIGLIGLVLSLYLIAFFLEGRGDMGRCPTRNKKGRNLMRATFDLLFIPLVLGLVLRFVQF